MAGLGYFNPYKKTGHQKKFSESEESRSSGGDNFDKNIKIQPMKQENEEKEKENDKIKKHQSKKNVAVNEDIHEEKTKEKNEEKNEEEKEKEKYNEIKKYKIIKLKKEGERNKGIDYIDCEHVICFECFEKNKVNNILHVSNSSDDEQDESNKYFIDVTNGTCFCRLCNKKHFLLDKSSKDSACCKTALCSLI